MTLVIEDGTGLANAQSYVSAADARIYANLRGITLPADDATLEPFLIQACDYLEAQRNRYQGVKATATQALQFPRIALNNYNQLGYENDYYYGCNDYQCGPIGITIDGCSVGINYIPPMLISAQIQLAISVSQGVDLQPNRTGSFVKSEKVGVIEVVYSEIIGTSVEPLLTAVDNLLQPLYKNGSSSFSLTVSRA